MRKLAPAFILGTLVALGSGSALALGDMNKNRKAPSADVSATQQTTPSSTQANEAKPSGAPATTPEAGAAVSGSASMGAGNGATLGASGSASMGAGDTAMRDGAKDKKKQAARNDDRCDESKYPDRSQLPKDCLTHGGTGAAATSSTQVQSGK